MHSPTTAVVDFGMVAEALADHYSSRRSDPFGNGDPIAANRRGNEDGAGRAPRRRSTTFDRVVICAAFTAIDWRSRGRRGAPLSCLFGANTSSWWLVAPISCVRLSTPCPSPDCPFSGAFHVARRRNRVDRTKRSPGVGAGGYRGSQIEAATICELLGYEGFRKMARTYWASGLSELASSDSSKIYFRRARRYIPELEPSDLGARSAGIRAQAVDRNGQLVDDFVVHRRGPVIAVRNAPSPAATASLAIASYICDEFPV